MDLHQKAFHIATVVMQTYMSRGSVLAECFSPLPHTLWAINPNEWCPSGRKNSSVCYTTNSNSVVMETISHKTRRYWGCVDGGVGLMLCQRRRCRPGITPTPRQSFSGALFLVLHCWELHTVNGRGQFLAEQQKNACGDNDYMHSATEVGQHTVLILLWRKLWNIFVHPPPPPPHLQHTQFFLTF